MCCDTIKSREMEDREEHPKYQHFVGNVHQENSNGAHSFEAVMGWLDRVEKVLDEAQSVLNE